jgi:hypothetical protein
VKHGVRFSIAFFQVEKLTKWLTHANWWRNCAYANLLLKPFILNYTAFEISFQKNGMNSLQPQL